MRPRCQLKETALIVCVSINPALDRRLILSTLKLGAVNRAHSAEGAPGGKAAHVALAARSLGARVRFVGFLGGPTGEAIARGLSAAGIEVESISAATPTRINLELIDDSGVTEILEPGAAPTPHELEEILGRCRGLFTACPPGAIVALSGSLPTGTAMDLYPQLVQLAKAHGLTCILDTSGLWLEEGLAAGPDFVKPNREEAEALLKCRIRTESDAKAALQQLVERGARSAILSLGSTGLLGKSCERTFLVAPPQVVTRSSVGCGDATVAGLAVALERGYEGCEPLAFAAACGAANCLARSPGCLDPAAVESLRSRTQTRWLD